MDRQKQNDFSPLEQEVSNQKLPPGLSFANTKRSLGFNKMGFLKMINSVIEVWDFLFVIKEIIGFRQKLKIIIIDALNGPWWPNDQIGFVRER